MTTSSPKSFKSYNELALRGAGVDDMEYINDWNTNELHKGLGTLDEDLAYTPKLNDVVIDRVYQDAIANGTDPAKAAENKAFAQRKIKELLAKNGMLK